MRSQCLLEICLSVLVAKGLIQQCLLGVDFLTHNGCVVDLQSGQMSVAGNVYHFGHDRGTYHHLKLVMLPCSRTQ